MNKYQCTKCKEYKAIAPLTSCDDCNEKQVELERLAEIGKALIELNGRKLGVFINIEKMLSEFRNGMVE